MDPQTRILIDKIGIALSLLFGLTAVIGEGLGWWGANGIVLSLFSLALGVLAVLDLTGRRLLDSVALLQRGQSTLHEDHAQPIETQETMVRTQQGIGRTLDAIERLLD